MAFLTKPKHFMTLKIKDKTVFLRNCILDNLINRENSNFRDLFVDKGYRSGPATLVKTFVIFRNFALVILSP